jgi:Tfp pilus assembly protein PilX
MRNIHSKQRGAALVMGLILLTVITLLAVVGMNIANTELAGATSDQLRMRAFNAAETGLETRIQSLWVDRTTSTTPDIRPVEPVENSPRNTVTDAAADTYETTTVFRGEGSMISRFSTGTFVGFHYSVESTGHSSRNAEAVHTAGAFVTNGVGDAPSYTQLTGAAPYVARPPAAGASPPVVTP